MIYITLTKRKLERFNHFIISVCTLSVCEGSPGFKEYNETLSKEIEETKTFDLTNTEEKWKYKKIHNYRDNALIDFVVVVILTVWEAPYVKL